MRISATPSFSNWLLSVKRYPFNELRATRHGFTCKYVICDINSNEKYSCVPTKNFDHVSILEDLIMQGECKPLPPDMTNIMDYMFYWGLQKSPRWYHKVLSTLSGMLVGPEPCERKDMFMECIYWLVREMIMDSSYDFYSNEGQIVMDAWHGYCCHWYDYNNKFSFQILTSMSQSFVVDCIKDLDSLGFLQPHNAVHCGTVM
ncbi:expressed unknown protein [Seminavis robusta]|uniref:Uncharacterized protein n=1 Tax=Seminavis robusta TaxID=568900 RepID=A0A9N8E9M6_9STRA|nr:expressed unknown protein [Seminavis robusta]|eukprot:Sro699_g189471.1  (202) ;mRNA; r:33336-33941